MRPWIFLLWLKRDAQGEGPKIQNANEVGDIREGARNVDDQARNIGDDVWDIGYKARIQNIWDEARDAQDEAQDMHSQWLFFFISSSNLISSSERQIVKSPQTLGRTCSPGGGGPHISESSRFCEVLVCGTG